MASRVYYIGVPDGIDVKGGRCSFRSCVPIEAICPQGVQIHCSNAARLSYSDTSFVLVFQLAVCSSIEFHQVPLAPPRASLLASCSWLGS